VEKKGGAAELVNLDNSNPIIPHSLSFPSLKKGGNNNIKKERTRTERERTDNNNCINVNNNKTNKQQHK